MSEEKKKPPESFADDLAEIKSAVVVEPEEQKKLQQTLEQAKYTLEQKKILIITGITLFIFGYLIYVWLARTLMDYDLTGDWNSAFGWTSNWMNFIFWPGFQDVAFMAVILVALIVFYIAFSEVEKMKKNTRPKAEHGSAKKGDISEAKTLQSSQSLDDILLSNSVRLNMNTRETNLNNNVMVIGDSGSWKTMSYVKPNILQMHSNYVVLDPKGSVMEEIGNALKEGGYDIRYLNLVDMSKSMGYNPFHYFEEPNDVQKFVNSLIQNTTGDQKTGGDPFFEKAEVTFITALSFYVRYVFHGMAEENFNTVMDLLLLANAKEEEGADDYKSPLDLLFDDLEESISSRISYGDPYEDYQFGDLAVKNYKLFKMSAGKTAKSILVSVGVRLSVFNLPSLKRIMEKDEIHLERLGIPLVKSKKFGDDLKRDVTRQVWEEGMRRSGKDDDYEALKANQLRKTILFIIISDSDRTFSFLSSIILQQVYDQMYRAADARKDHALPIHTRIINDEFATTGKQLDIDIKTATMRSRNISASFIVQGLSQLKCLYEKQWEAIFENCSTTLFLGGKGPTTTEMLSKLIGNETVVYKSETVNKGRSGGVSYTDQIYQRPLYGPDEINRIPTNHCLIHIRGRQIYEDEKYDLFSHPNIAHTVNDKSLSDAAREKNRFIISEYKPELDEIEMERNRRCSNPEEFEPDEYRGFIDGTLSIQAQRLYFYSDQVEEALNKQLNGEAEETENPLIELFD